MEIEKLNKDETLVRKQRSLMEEAFIRLVRNKVAFISSIFVILLIFTAIFSGIIAPYDYAEQDLKANNAVPEWMLIIMPENAANYANISDKYPFGADSLGRDIFSRVIYGTRISLSFALVASLVSLVVGTLYGTVAGYVGGHLDDFMMRAVDFLYAFPFLIVVILLQTYFKAIGRVGGATGFGA